MLPASDAPGIARFDASGEQGAFSPRRLPPGWRTATRAAVRRWIQRVPEARALRWVERCAHHVALRASTTTKALAPQ
jgi:hypothetical protein